MTEPARPKARSRAVKTLLAGSRVFALAPFALALGLATSACGNYDAIASTVAHGQVGAADVVRRDGAMAAALCRETATYTYWQTRLILERMGGALPLSTFPAWYDTEKAGDGADGKPISWNRYCRELDATGAVYHGAVLVLRAYALAVASLADAKDFDGSGLDNLGGGISSAARSLSAPTSVVSAAKGVGSAASQIAGYLVKIVRTEALKDVVKHSRTDVHDVVAGLGAYLDALEEERAKRLANAENELSKSLSVPRDASTPLVPAFDGAIAYDLALGGDEHLARYGRQLAADRKLVAAVGRASEALAEAAASRAREHEAKDAATALTRALEDLKNARPEEP